LADRCEGYKIGYFVKVSVFCYVFEQTDNGSEFIGYIFKKKPSGFTELVEKVYLARHQRIFQARIEKEFYDNGECQVKQFHSPLSSRGCVITPVLLVIMQKIR